MTTFYLSRTPPSVNTLYVHVPGKGRTKTLDYRTWIRLSAAELALQRPEPFTSRVDIVIRIPEPVRGDVSNRIKAAEDLLVRTGVLPDDNGKHVRSCKAEFADVPRTEIIVTAIEPEGTQ
jgi:Holliday junction resolvase RusA-like endonuclease